MPVILGLMAVILFAAAIRGTQPLLFEALKSDFTGQDNFLTWSVAILILGVAGNIKVIRPVTNAFLVLVLIVLLLKNGNPDKGGGGFFSLFGPELKKGTQGGDAGGDSLDHFAQAKASNVANGVVGFGRATLNKLLN